jgi:hypothetical protein
VDEGDEVREAVPVEPLRPYCVYRKRTATAASHQTWFPNPKSTRTTVPAMTMVPIRASVGVGEYERCRIAVPTGRWGKGDRPSVRRE